MDAAEGAEHYDAQVSSDNGVTWKEMNNSNTDVSCWNISPDGKYKKVEFAVAEGQQWKIRVKDTYTNDWTDNEGNLSY
ncbi:hypothetical protein GM535_13790, partial [Streptococcus pneumoniae]|nr:hypothetical protein [Streptococcus pneumoniae]